MSDQGRKDHSCTRPRALGHHVRYNPRSVGVRVVLVLFAIVMIDISAARLRYHYHLMYDLGPVKAAIEAATYEYHGHIPDALKNCQAFDRSSHIYIHNCSLSACEQNALLLSDKRQRILEHVRASHLTSGVISELFDGYRGVDQSVKIEKLFARKSCEGVIASSDKTNQTVDSLAVVTLFSALVIVWRCMRFFIRSWRMVKVD